MTLVQWLSALAGLINVSARVDPLISLCHHGRIFPSIDDQNRR